MNSERRRKKGLQRVPRGDFNVVKKDNVGFASARDDYQPEKEPTVDYENVQDIPEDTQAGTDGLETYDIVDEQPSLSATEALPESTADEGSEKNISARFFGFVRNKFDDAVDDFKQRRRIKQEVYKKYLEQKPTVLAGRYEKMYNQKLQEIANPSLRQKPIIDTFGQVSTGIKNVGEFFGGRVRPDQVMGFRGTILGPLPTGVSPMQEQMMMQQSNNLRRMASIQGSRQDYGNEYLVQQPSGTGGYAMPERYMQPGIVGSQVPKYSSRPYNAPQGTEWGLIQKYDQYGKKRSYMRKLRIPGMQQQMQQSQQGRVINVTPQQQQMMEAPRNPLGVGFTPERLIVYSKTGGVNLNNLVNLVKAKAEQPGFDVKKFI